MTEPSAIWKKPGQVGRALLVGQRHRLLGRQRVAPAGGVVVDVAARGLRVQPLAHVALADAGAPRQLGRRQAAGAGERAVEAELVAHHDERRVEGRADLVDGAEDELLELVGVELRRHCSVVAIVSLLQVDFARP